MALTKPLNNFRPVESPTAWFGEMLIAIHRGDFECAAESQRRLDRVGCRIKRKTGRAAPPESARRLGGDA
jgi:hypothetical protein